MSIVGHGIDLIECDRIAKVMENHGRRFLDRVLTPAEQERVKLLKAPIQFIAGRWAAKEAILRALGTGWRGDAGKACGSLGEPRRRLNASRDGPIQPSARLLAHSRKKGLDQAVPPFVWMTRT